MEVITDPHGASDTILLKTALVLLLLPVAAAAQGRSPFLPPSGQGIGPEGPAEAYELAGASVSSIGAQICLYDRAHKQSRWLPVGETSDGIEVLSYDPASDQAVVRFDGATHVLSLRKAAINSSGAPAVAYVAPTPVLRSVPNRPIVDPSTIGKSPEVVKQEREARMLVSDLLEIGMEQRKAYQEAQKKARAQGGGS